ncbi:helix-turn-helix domain-containing protein [Sphingomonas sp. NPDC079357]|uniref:helix-turn-helix domain-containing protein n=1 Tax=Sphingomonas sp. NPDC079357 TaxID=3364518 RepID=UPI00384D9376
MARVSVISSAQCRAARAMLNWTQGELARRAGVARTTLVNFERDIRMTTLTNLSLITSALENAGITFLPERRAVGAGVRFNPSVGSRLSPQRRSSRTAVESSSAVT